MNSVGLLSSPLGDLRVYAYIVYTLLPTTSERANVPYDEIVGTQRKLKEAAPSGKAAAGDSLAQSLGAGKAASTANPLMRNQWVWAL